MIQDDTAQMKAAMRLAIKAQTEGEPPIGAVIVRDGKIVGRGRNRREACQDVTRHAEIEAIRQASRRLGSWRLDGCVLYVTLEPCVMCAGAIVQARIGEVVFGARDPKAGAAGSVTNIFDLRMNHQVKVRGGILEAECSALLKTFFKKRRELDKSMGSRGKRKQDAIRAIAETRKSRPG